MLPPYIDRLRDSLGCDSVSATTGVVAFPSANDVTCATPSRPGARTLPSGAFRSVLTESLLFLPLPPTASGTKRTTACLLRRVSATFPGALHPSQAPGLFFPDARDTLQTSPIKICSWNYSNPV